MKIWRLWLLSGALVACGEADDVSVIPLNDASETQEDAAIAIKDGSADAEDAEIAVEDGSTDAEDAAIAVEDGSADAEDAEIVIEDGSADAEDAEIVIEDGAADAEGAEVVIEDDSEVWEDSEIVIEDGSADAEDAEIVIEEDSEVWEDAEIVIEDGSLDAEDGSITDVDGSEDDDPRAPCAEWRLLNDQALLSTLNRRLHDDYLPIDLDEDPSGDRNRYDAARFLMYQLSWVTNPYYDDRGGAECIYTGDFYNYEQGSKPSSEAMNCEHVWPKSGMNPNERSALRRHQEADLLMIRPVGTRVNNCRSNNPFGEVVTVLKDEFEPALYGKNAQQMIVFEPRDEVKGDVARIMFYFATRWALDLSAMEEPVLRAWADLDPVDDEERLYQDAVAEIQGNRNPFIDCPGLEKNVQDFGNFSGASNNANLPMP